MCTCITFDGDFSNINQNKIPDRVLWPQFLNIEKKGKKLKKIWEQKSLKLFNTYSVQLLCMYVVNVQIYCIIQKSQIILYELEVFFDFSNNIVYHF